MNEPKQQASNFMPQSVEAYKVLHKRAELLAKEKFETKKSVDGVDYVRFTLGESGAYGISYAFIKEILPNVEPTAIPCAPNFVSGVINWRGALLPVIDIRQFFLSEQSTDNPNAYGIVITASNITLIFLVEEIEGTKMYQPINLEEPLTSATAANPDYIAGIHQGVVAIIDVEAVLAALKLELEKGSNIPI